MSNIAQNKLSVYMTDELKQIVQQEAKEKSMSTSAFIVTLINDYLFYSKSQNKYLYYKELDKLMSKPTKENYNRFIDTIQDAFVSRQLPETEYNRLYSMAKIIPIK